MNNIFRVGIVLFIVGLGQLLSLWFTSYSIESFDQTTIKGIIKFDVAIAFAIGFCNFGVGQYYPKSLLDDSKYANAVVESRTVKFVLSLILFIVAILLLFLGEREYAFGLLVAPFIAYGVEHVLYVVKRPICAATVSFIRNTGVYLLILLLSLIPGVLTNDNIFQILLISFICCSLVASIYSVWTLSVSFYFRIKLPDRQTWISIASLGGAFFSYSNFKYLLVPLSENFISISEMIHVFVFIKIYILVFSVRRIFVQFFIGWLNNQVTFKKVSILYLSMSLIFVILCFLSKTYIGFEPLKLYFGFDSNYTVYVYVLLIVMSLFPFYPTRLIIYGLYRKYSLMYWFAIVSGLLISVPLIYAFGAIGAFITIVVIEFSIGCLSFIWRHKSV